MTTRTLERDVDPFIHKAICPLPPMEDREEHLPLIAAHQEGLRARDRLVRAYGRLITSFAVGYDEALLDEADPNLHIRASRARTGFIHAVLTFRWRRHHEFDRLAESEIRRALGRPSPSPHRLQRFLAREQVLAQFDGGTPLTSDERRMLIDQAQRGQVALEQFLLRNGALVMSMATEKYSSDALWDRCSEGRIGLMETADRFDPMRGTEVSTYAGQWIRQRIRLYRKNHGRNVRVPVQILEAIWRLHRSARRLGPDASPETLAEDARVDPSQIAQFSLIAKREFSLERPLRDKDGDTESTFGERLHGETPLPDECCIGRELQAAIDSAIQGLPERERLVIIGSFYDDRSLKDIGENTLGRSRNRAQQLKEIALKRLRKVLAAQATEAA